MPRSLQGVAERAEDIDTDRARRKHEQLEREEDREDAAVRAARADAQVGVANILTHVRPATERAEDIAAAERVDLNNNRLFLDPVLGGSYTPAITDLYGTHGLESLIRADDEATIGALLDSYRERGIRRLVDRIR